MPTTYDTTDTATIRRFHDAVNNGDVALIAETIDEVVERAWHERAGRLARAHDNRQTREAA